MRVSITSANLYFVEERVAFMFFTFEPEVRAMQYFSFYGSLRRRTHRRYLKTVKLNIYAAVQ